jgi:hypothetical protein
MLGALPLENIGCVGVSNRGHGMWPHCEGCGWEAVKVGTEL